MVDLKGLLEPVDGDPALHEHQPGVVDEHVQGVEAREQRARGVAHGVEVRVVAVHDVHARVAGLRRDLLACEGAALLAAAQQHDGRVHPGERKRRLEPEPGARAGDRAERPFIGGQLAAGARHERTGHARRYPAIVV